MKIASIFPVDIEFVNKCIFDMTTADHCSDENITLELKTRHNAFVECIKIGQSGYFTTTDDDDETGNNNLLGGVLPLNSLFLQIATTQIIMNGTMHE
jgi:hypothetical protein